jgi:hypothetical protein
MKLFYWNNIQGIGNSDSRIALGDFYSTHKPLLLFITKPMVPFSAILVWLDSLPTVLVLFPDRIGLPIYRFP